MVYEILLILGFFNEVCPTFFIAISVPTIEGLEFYNISLPQLKSFNKPTLALEKLNEDYLIGELPSRRVNERKPMLIIIHNSTKLISKKTIII